MSGSAEGGAELPVVEGDAYSPSLKVLATVVMAALAAAGVRAAADGHFAGAGSSGLLLLGFMVMIVAAGYWNVLKSRTRIDGRSIRQTGLWDKEVQLAQITRVKLIHVPGFSWLIAPRLVVRSGGIGSTTFHAGDARLLAAFHRLAYG